MGADLRVSPELWSHPGIRLKQPSQNRNTLETGHYEDLSGIPVFTNYLSRIRADNDARSLYKPSCYKTSCFSALYESAHPTLLSVSAHVSIYNLSCAERVGYRLHCAVVLHNDNQENIFISFTDCQNSLDSDDA